MEGIMIALSILIGCIFIGIELRKGLGEKSNDENKSESESKKYNSYRCITVLGENYNSVAAVLDKFKEYNPTKNVVYDRVKDGTIDEYISTLIEKKKAEERKTKKAEEIKAKKAEKEPEKEKNIYKVYVTEKMPARLLIKYNFKVGDWVQDIPTLIERTSLTYCSINYWKRNKYIEIK